MLTGCYGNCSLLRRSFYQLIKPPQVVQNQYYTVQTFSISQHVRTVCPLACPHPAVSMRLWRKLPVHIAAGGEGGSTRLPSQQRVCFPPEAMHGESGLFILWCPWGEKCSTHKLCKLKSGKKNFFFFPFYILRMTIGRLGQPGSLEGSQLRERKWKCSAMAEGGDWSSLFLPVHTLIQTFWSAADKSAPVNTIKAARAHRWGVCRWPVLERFSQFNQIKFKKKKKKAVSSLLPSDTYTHTDLS